MSNYNRWTDTQLKFLKDNLDNNTYVELANIMTEKFDRLFTPSILSSKARLAGFKKADNKTKWTVEQDDYIKELRLSSTPVIDIHKMVNEKFGTDYTDSSVNARAAKLGYHYTRKVMSNIVSEIDPITTIEGGVAFCDSKPTACMYMITGRAESHVCGKEKVHGSYCLEHYILTHMPIQSRKITDEIARKHDIAYNRGDYKQQKEKTQ